MIIPKKADRSLVSPTKDKITVDSNIESRIANGSSPMPTTTNIAPKKKTRIVKVIKTRPAGRMQEKF